MRNVLRALFVTVLLATPILAMPYSAAPRPQDEKKQRSEAKYREKLYKEVRHQLVMLPWYSVFDNLAYQVDGDKGDAVRPSHPANLEIRRRGSREEHRGSGLGCEQYRGSSTVADG